MTYLLDTDTCIHLLNRKTGLEANGTPIGPLDTLIAAQAVSRGCVLVTCNVREFSRVRGLRLENWIAAPPA